MPWILFEYGLIENIFVPKGPECTIIAPVINANVKRNPNPNPNPNLTPYPTPNQKPNYYPHSNSLLPEISWQEQI